MRRTSRQESTLPEFGKLYSEFTREHDYCWACGRDWRERPPEWFIPFFVERAHIVNHPRVERREMIAALCTMCHRRSHGIRDVVWHRLRRDWPPLERQHLLWLKEKFDPNYFDLNLLQKCAIGRLPAPCAPPDCYLNEFRQRRPEFKVA